MPSYYGTICNIQQNGTILWGPISFTGTSSGGFGISLVNDGKNGAIITWRYYISSGNLNYVKAARFSSNGYLIWSDQISDSSSSPKIVSDSSFGAIIVYYRNNLIRAQRVDSNGTKLWSTNGVSISNLAGYYLLDIVNTQYGNHIVRWLDSFDRTRVQKISNSGAIKWGINGIVLIESFSPDQLSSMSSDGQGGCILTFRPYSKYLYANRVDSNGIILWPSERTIISSSKYLGNYPKIIRGNLGFIISWGNGDIFSQYVGLNGFESISYPSILSIQDITNDQGGKVRIKFSGARDDVSPAVDPITQYGLWRKIPPGMSAFGKRALSALVVDDSIAMNYDFITSVPAMQSSQYNVVSPTLIDSNGIGTNWTKFIVTAHTSTPSVYYVSDTDSGYSIDNFPLPPPSNLTVNFDGNTARLLWNSIPPDTNFAYYSVYRLEKPSCDSYWVRITTTPDTAFADNNFDTSSTLAYRVSAVKRNGNESNSNEVSSGITTNFHSYAVSSHWNIVSVPLVLSDIITTHIFPTAISDAFAYEGSYVTKSTLEGGTGYWLKFNSNQAVCMHGNLITQDTITVVDGWNLIGSISEPVSVSSITSDPDGITTSDFFEYTGSYSITDTIQPGKGYWVKVNQAGSLILSAPSTGLAKSSASRIRIVPTSELPPPPPDGNTTTIEIPKQFVIEQNYPNPFNPITVFRYQLPIGSKVTLRIYNLLGQEIKTLVDDWQDAGYKTVEWDASNFVSGVYFYRIQAGTFAETKRLLLIR